MSENESGATTTEPAQVDGAKPAEQQKVDDIDWKAKAREWERRAKDNKGAADELARIQEAQKSEAEKAADALKQAQSDAENARAELLRYKTAAAHGITDADDIELFLTGTDRETLTRQAERLAARAPESGSRAPKPDPNQGASGTSTPSTADMFGDFISKQIG